MRRQWVIVIAFASLAAGCGGGARAPGVVADPPVVVGALFDLTGLTADVGTPYSHGVRDYVEFRNAHGGVAGGRRIDLRWNDYAHNVATARLLYNQDRAAGAVAIIGSATADTETLISSATTDRLPFLTPSLAEPITDPSVAPYDFPVGTTYSDQMRIALSWIAGQNRGHHVEVAAFYGLCSDTTATPSPTPKRIAMATTQELAGGPTANEPGAAHSLYGSAPLSDGRRYIADNHLDIGFETYKIPSNSRAVVSDPDTLHGLLLRAGEVQKAQYVIIQNLPTAAAAVLKDGAITGGGMHIVCLSYCTADELIPMSGGAAEGVVGVAPWLPVAVAAGAPGAAQPRAVATSQGRDLDGEGVGYLEGWYLAAMLASAIDEAAASGTVTGESVRAALENGRPFDAGGVSVDPLRFTRWSHKAMHGGILVQVRNGTWVRMSDELRP